MKKLIETLKNIWKIEDLRQRILITMLFVAIYRFGSFVVLPGINPALDMFSGGAFSNASIFALGIMPYISASIVMQLLAVAVPYFQKMQREGESGRKKIMTYTRYLYPAVPGTELSHQSEDAGRCCSGSWYQLVNLRIPSNYHSGCRQYVHPLAG